MGEQEQVFIFAASNIQELLADNQTDLVELLNHEGLSVRRDFASNPVQSGDSAEKEPVTVILASAALVLAMTPVISRVLSTLSRRPVVAKEMALVPLEDSAGNVIKGPDGEPRCHWVERTKLLELSKQSQPRQDLTIKGFGFELSFQDTADR